MSALCDEVYRLACRIRDIAEELDDDELWSGALAVAGRAVVLKREGRRGVDGDTPDHDSRERESLSPTVRATVAGSEPADGHQ